MPRPKPGKWGRNGRVETLTNVVGLLVWFGLFWVRLEHYELSIWTLNSFLLILLFKMLNWCVISRNHGAHRNLLFNPFDTILYEMAHAPQICTTRNLTWVYGSGALYYAQLPSKSSVCFTILCFHCPKSSQIEKPRQVLGDITSLIDPNLQGCPRSLTASQRCQKEILRETSIMLPKFQHGSQAWFFSLKKSWPRNFHQFHLRISCRKNDCRRAWGMLQLFRVDCTNRLLWSPWVKSLVSDITNSFENGSILQEIDFVGNILIWTARLPEELFGVWCVVDRNH